VRLHGDQPAQALEAFEAALRNVNAPGDYHNSLVELADVRALFESAFQQLRQAEAFQEAVQLTALYEKIAPPGVAAQLGGEAAEAAALALRTAHSSSDDVARRKEEEARQLFRKAGLAFEASAAVATTPAQQMERLWRSITDYLEGRDHARAVEVLERYVRLPIPLERQGQAWYVLAEAYRTLRKPDARGAYEKCIEYPGPFAFRARYEIAVAKIEQKKFDDAEEDLRQNLQLMQTAPDPDAHEKTLVTLASLLYQQHNYSRAYDKLKEALERYPANPNAVRLRLQLAQCCRRRAEEVGERIGFQSSPGISSADEQRHLRAQRQGFLEEAAAHFQALVDNLETTQVQQKLTPEQENILGQARFAVADCRFDLGQYSQALFLFDVLAKRYEGQVEALIALQHVWQCHGVLFQAEEAKMTLERIRTAMAHTTYDGSAENRTHAWWEDWLAKQAKLREAARPNGR
jgi:tetratricopeptide (TPR) repeat protein